MPSKVFISYRREDSRYQARRVYDAFVHALPPDTVFMDVDSIPPGADFVEILEGWVQQCDVLLALIGPNWLSSIDPRTGLRRLDNPEDFVRIEVRGALQRKIPVVPVLLDATEMPTAAELSDDIKALRRRHAEFVDFRTFDADVQRLIKRLKLGKEIELPGEAPAPQAADDGGRRTEATAPKPVLERVRSHATGGTPWLLVAAVVSLLIVVGAVVVIYVVKAGIYAESGGGLADVMKSEESRRAAEARASEATDALAKAEKARQEAEAKAADAAAALVRTEENRRAAEARANDAAEAVKKSDKARLDAEARATSAAAAQGKAEEGQRTAEKARAAAETAASAAATARDQGEAARQIAELRANDAADALKKSEKARQDAEAKLAALTKPPEFIADPRPSAPPPSVGRPTAGSPSSASRKLLTDIGSKSRWVFGEKTNCNAKDTTFVSLEVGSGSITWINGLGNRISERVLASDENTFRTEGNGLTWAYSRNGDNIDAQASIGRPFVMKRCS